jgi:hypothetical protein
MCDTVIAQKRVETTALIANRFRCAPSISTCIAFMAATYVAFVECAIPNG